MDSSRWDISNWKSGKVTVPEAFGITRGKFTYPQLRATLPGKVAQAHSAEGSGASGGNKGNPSGKTALQNQALGKQMAASYGWTGKQWTDLNNIVMSESGWSTSAENQASGAYGIPQALPGSKMAADGSNWKTSARTQIKWMLAYIRGRYGTPERAWQFHLANGWY